MSVSTIAPFSQTPAKPNHFSHYDDFPSYDSGDFSSTNGTGTGAAVAHDGTQPFGNIKLTTGDADTNNQEIASEPLFKFDKKGMKYIFGFGINPDDALESRIAVGAIADVSGFSKGTYTNADGFLLKKDDDANTVDIAFLNNGTADVHESTAVIVADEVNNFIVEITLDPDTDEKASFEVYMNASTRDKGELILSGTTTGLGNTDMVSLVAGYTTGAAANKNMLLDYWGCHVPRNTKGVV